MAISFACSCGKQFKVADEYAGKRTRCPSCQSLLIVPAPQPQAQPEPVPTPAESEEDVAFRALSEGPDPAPTPQSREWQAPPIPSVPPPKPTPASPAARKAPPTTKKSKSKPRSAAYDPYAPPQRSWKVDGSAVASGIGLAVLGALLFLGLWVAGYIWPYALFLVGAGVITVISGLFNTE